VFTISTPGELKVNNWLSEVTIYVIIGARVYRHSKDLLGVTELNHISGLVVIG
jgi:hypothetical protein